MLRFSVVWERVAPWISGVAIVLVLVFSVTVLYQNHEIRQAQQELQTFTNHAHSNTVAILKEHTATLNQDKITLAEVATLRQEVETLAKTLGPELTAGQNVLIAQYRYIECQIVTPGQCGAAP